LDTRGQPPIDLRWLAGYMDGEAYFGVNANRGIVISIANTHKPSLDYIQSALGGAVYAHNKTKTSLKPHWRPQYRWQILGKRAAEVSQLVLPYLHEKKEQAKLLVQYYDLGYGRSVVKNITPELKQRRAEIKEEITRLKHIAFSKRRTN